MSRAPSRVTTAFGVHVRGTPLWIDAAQKKPLCVVTCVIDKLPPKHARLFATAELARLLAAAGHGGKVLPTPRDRWVGVGGERLMLVDAGPHGLAAGVQVTLADETVLITGPLRAAPVDWPRADHIVTHLPALQHRGEAFADVADAVAKLAGRDRCSVRVESLEIADALMAALYARGVVAKGRGFLRFANASQAGPARVSVGLGRLAHAKGRTVDIDAGLGRFTGGASQRLPLRWYADRAAVHELVEQTRVRRLTLVGNRDPKLDLAGEVVWRSEPQQLVLGAPAQG